MSDSIKKCKVYDGKTCDGKFKEDCQLCILVLMEKHLYKLMKAFPVKEVSANKSKKSR
jgi:hypothetical protein